MTKSTAVLYYFHDPMCSWCWGYRPVWQQFKKALPAELRVENILGGLAVDTEEPMPIKLQEAIKAHWKHIESELGTVFNFSYWTENKPRRSTYQACRAVLTARRQGLEEAMIEAIQRAYYLRAMNPSDDEVLAQLSREVGLDEAQYCRDLVSEDVQRQLEEQIEFSRATHISGFPSLFLQCDERDSDGRHHTKMLPIIVDYRDYQPSLDQIIRSLSSY